MYFLPPKLVVLNLLLAGWFPLSFNSNNQTSPVIKGPVVQNVTTSCATVIWTKGEGTDNSHSIELTGLKPGKHYSVDMNKYGLNAKVSFETAPADSSPFSFVVFGDTRSRHEVHRKIVNLILKDHPEFVIHTGDLVHNGNSSGEWNTFFEIENNLLSTTAFYPMLGNHERNAAAYYKFFSFPDDGDGRRYSFDWGTAHIAVLDTNEFGKPSFNEEVAWLKKDLARNKKPLTFVAFHHPLYTAVKSRRKSAAKLAAVLEPILLANRVTAVFSGHDHDYQHHVKSGIHYIVTGGGGAPLRNGSPIPGLTVKFAEIENFVRIHVNGNRAHVEATDINGNPLDSFDLTGRGPAPSQKARPLARATAAKP